MGVFLGDSYVFYRSSFVCLIAFFTLAVFVIFLHVLIDFVFLIFVIVVILLIIFFDSSEFQSDVVVLSRLSGFSGICECFRKA